MALGRRRWRPISWVMLRQTQPPVVTRRGADSVERSAARRGLFACGEERAFEGENGFVNVDEGAELVDVGVAVAVERVEGVDIQRGGGPLGRQGAGLVFE